MTAGQTFNKGAVVQVVAAGTVTVLPEDGTEILVSDIIAQGGACFGVAINGPGAASSAAIPEDSVKIDPDTGNAYTTTTWINYVPANQGILFRTSNILATGGAAAETAASITGADRGDAFFITYCSATTPDLGWGVERTSATAGMATEVWAKIVDVLDARGRSVPTAATVGTQYVFEIVSPTLA
jgi:hypothetical protein